MALLTASAPRTEHVRSARVPARSTHDDRAEGPGERRRDHEQVRLSWHSRARAPRPRWARVRTAAPLVVAVVLLFAVTMAAAIGLREALDLGAWFLSTP